MVLTGTWKQCIDCGMNSERPERGEERKLLVELGKVRVTAAHVAGEEAGVWPLEMSKARSSFFLGVPKGSDTPALIGSQLVSSGR